MSDLLQVSDLERAKLHDTFHSEVITGKVGGLAGGADIDYATNAVTSQSQKTLPKILDDIDWSYVGLFADGVTFTKRTDFALDAVGIQWVYVGNYPFTATAGTVPSEPLYQVVHVRDHNSFSNRNAAGAHDASAINDLGGTTVQAFIDSNHSTVTELASGKFPVGRRVTIINRDDGVFTVQAGGIPDGKGVLDAGNGNTAIITGIVTPEMFGIVADWNGTTGTDNTEAYLAFNAYCLANNLQQNWKGGPYYFASVELPVSVDMKGAKDTKFYFLPAATLKNCLVLAEDVTVKRIKTYPSVTDAVRNYFNNDKVEDFNYHTKHAGLRLNNDSTVIDSDSLSAARGVTATDGSSNISLIRGLYQGGVWGTSIYNCKHITMDNITVHGGTDGGMAMPSCKYVNVAGGFVYNPDGTGVNTGGSSAAGFNAEYINVTGVQVFARDCINLENGCEHSVVSGNICDVISSSISNGVGIGVHTRAGGGQVHTMVISGNEISSSYGTYSTAIKVGDLSAGFDTYGICIGPNKAGKCRQGILMENKNVGKKNYDFEIAGGNYDCYDRGLSMYGTHDDGVVNGGRYSRDESTTVSSTYGIELGTLTKVQINMVTTKGWSPHLRQLGQVTASKISQHTFLSGDDNAPITKLSNASGFPNITFSETI